MREDVTVKITVPEYRQPKNMTELETTATTLTASVTTAIRKYNNTDDDILKYW